MLYLIEDVDVDNLVQRYGSQIQTAISSTQVIDGFFVHRTANGESSADFLASIHECVKTMYKVRVSVSLSDRPQETELYVLPDEVIMRENYADVQRQLRAQQPERVFHTSFHTFQAMNGKSSGGTPVQDIWAKMLMCVRGVSQEKAHEVVTRWPSPLALSSALASQERSAAAHVVAPDDAGRRYLCETVDVSVALARRKIGNALSSRIWQVMRSERYTAEH